MISNPSNQQSSLFSGFKNESESEEEGLIGYENEMDPQKFRVDTQLSSVQLFKFFEYYTKPSSPEGPFKYTKIDLNKINNLTHIHFLQISKDIKLFKCYKNLIQIVTQDMNYWIDKDYHCGDVILDILKEIEFRKENPKYSKLYNKLRIGEIIQRMIAKAEVLRRKAEEDRKNQKRLKNFEKKKLKNCRVDPFDEISLPSKRKSEEDESFEGFKRPVFIENQGVENDFLAKNEVFTESIEKKVENIFANSQKKFEKKNEVFVNKFRQHQKLLGALSLSENDFIPEDSEKEFEKHEEKTEKELEKPANNGENSEKFIEKYEEIAWYMSNFEDFISLSDSFAPIDRKPSEIPQWRIQPKKIDPRIPITLKCKGLDFILSSSLFSMSIEKIFIIINIKCLASIISIQDASKLVVQVPKETSQISVKNKQFFVSFRSGVNNFLEFAEKFSNVFIYSQYPAEISEAMFPGKQFLYEKKIEFSNELLIIFDNTDIGWNFLNVVPLLYYFPFEKHSEVFLDSSIGFVTNPEILNSLTEYAENQIDCLKNALKSIYSSFLQNKSEKWVAWEFKEYTQSILEGITIDTSEYNSRIGTKGYSSEKLEVYCNIVKVLGGKIEPNSNCRLVETKNHEKEISAQWILASFFTYSVMPKF